MVRTYILNFHGTGIGTGTSSWKDFQLQKDMYLKKKKKNENKLQSSFY